MAMMSDGNEDQPWQARPDGKIEQAPDPDNVPAAEKQKLIRDAFEGHGWKVEEYPSNTKQRYSITVTADEGPKDAPEQTALDLAIFADPKLSYRGRRLEEKGFQASEHYLEYFRNEFRRPKTGRERCLLMSVYCYRGSTVICAWDAARVAEPSSQKTLGYITVDVLARAMRDGFAWIEKTMGSGAKQIVCCLKPQMLPFYVVNMRDLHEGLLGNVADVSTGQPEVAGEGQAPYATLGLPRNRIIYGAPGTGKSAQTNREAEEYFTENNVRRVTFYPDYTYGQFFGSLKPIPIYAETEKRLEMPGESGAPPGEPMIDYRFRAGPLLEAIVDAVNEPSKNFLLIIEEINRANAPSVFGDCLQLLDRTDGGSSEFPIRTPPDAEMYLASRGVPSKSIILPPNLYLWATMNSADQGVMPLDSAFRRRWSFDYVPLDRYAEEVDDHEIYLGFAGGRASWNAFRNAINQQLLRHGFPEDRLLGPFFLTKSDLSDRDRFINKLLLYLRDDVVRHQPEVLFEGARSFGELSSAYSRGENVFNREMQLEALVQAE